MTRTGKIARLPDSVREQLNQRLLDGVKGRSLVAWLNAVPEVQAVMKAEFGGRPILDQNLTEWKQGGFLEWKAQRNLVEQAKVLKQNAAEIAAIGPAADHLAILLPPQIAVALREFLTNPCKRTDRHLKTFLAVSGEISAIRRGDHSAAMLAIEKERLFYERIMHEKNMTAAFMEFIERPEITHYIRGDKPRRAFDPEQLIELMFGPRPERFAQTERLDWSDWLGDGI